MVYLVWQYPECNPWRLWESLTQPCFTNYHALYRWAARLNLASFDFLSNLFSR